MGWNKVVLYVCTIISISSISVRAQGSEIDAVRNVSQSLNQFALKLLSETSIKLGSSNNLAISPYTVWSLLSIIAEGANGNTASQLEQVLMLPRNKDLFRRNYKSFTKYLVQQADGVQLDLNSAIFTSKDQNLNRIYQSMVKNYYGVDIMPTNFKNLAEAVNSINSHVAAATQNRIKNFVSADDVVNAEIMAVSTLFFKGRWKTPFNKTATLLDKFYDDSGNAKGQVNMMYQIGQYPYTILSNLKSHAVELPYGKGDRMSMIIILPRKGESLESVLKILANTPFSYVLNALQTAEEQFGEEFVQVYLPRFMINSDLNLNEILDHMGIKDVFNPNTADLLGIFPHYLYISRVIQEAKIEVNEEGTVASSAAGGSLQNKSPPPKFYANRDFAYFLVDKPTRSIVFAGKVSNPTSICDNCSLRN
ncbi:hypothetical protein FQR65_LT07936 [Abscondita terminalis]|nr:hypothetical protein FQR65_LT07936 [Abscondita terminalis]